MPRLAAPLLLPLRSPTHRNAAARSERGVLRCLRALVHGEAALPFSQIPAHACNLGHQQPHRILDIRRLHRNLFFPDLQRHAPYDALVSASGNRLFAEIDEPCKWLLRVEILCRLDIDIIATSFVSGCARALIMQVKDVLFFRNFGTLTGGHLKVWNYFNHVNHLPGYRAQIYFTPTSRWIPEADNPWLPLKDACLSEWLPQSADVLFMEGTDWHFLPMAFRQQPPCPVINLIQHVRHAVPENERYPFLRYPAIRICVSAEVSAALHACGIVNGPIYTIPNGIDFDLLPAPPLQRDFDVFINGKKNPLLARELGLRLQEHYPALRVQVLDQFVPRARFLDMLAKARIGVFLPHPRDGEGFYLPALESMALGVVVVCPDVVGNRSFCLPDRTCVMPEYTLEGLWQGIMQALSLSEGRRAHLRAEAYRAAANYTLANEQARFASILKDSDLIWKSFFPKHERSF